MSPRRALDSLVAELDERADAILAAARAAASAPHRWQHTMREWTGGDPRHGLGTNGAANGADVLACLRALEAVYEDRLATLHRTLDDEARDTWEDAFDEVRNRFIAGLGQRRTQEYNRSQAPGLGGVFARAAARQAHAPASETASTRTMVLCKRCAAPRQIDGLYGTCSYCGEALFKGGG